MWFNVVFKIMNNNNNKSKLNVDLPTSRCDGKIDHSESELNEPTPRTVEQQLNTVS